MDKIVLLTLNYHLFLFTDYVNDVRQYAGIANSVIYVFSIYISLRLGFEIILMLFNLSKHLKKEYYKRNRAAEIAKRRI